MRPFAFGGQNGKKQQTERTVAEAEASVDIAIKGIKCPKQVLGGSNRGM